MKKVCLVIYLFLYFSNAFGQDWIIVDIIGQSSKELVITIDEGKGEIEKEKLKNPSIVSLIYKYQNKGFSLEKVTHGVELDLNGSFPLNNFNRMNNFTNLTLTNSNRILLWFKKPKK